jgi:hypothetical protein
MRGKNNSEVRYCPLFAELLPALALWKQVGLFLVKSRYSWQNVPLKLAPKSKKRLGTSRVEPYPARVLQILDLSECEL